MKCYFMFKEKKELFYFLIIKNLNENYKVMKIYFLGLYWFCCKYDFEFYIYSINVLIKLVWIIEKY